MIFNLNRFDDTTTRKETIQKISKEKIFGKYI